MPGVSGQDSATCPASGNIATKSGPSYCKDKNVPDSTRGQPGVGSIWTWTALCAGTKLICDWQLGARDAATAGGMFIRDLSERLANRIQFTTDGNIYVNAIDDYFAEIDYVQLVKFDGSDPEGQQTVPPSALEHDGRPCRANRMLSTSARPTMSAGTSR